MGFGLSTFGFRICFGFRASDFGFDEENGTGPIVPLIDAHHPRARPTEEEGDVTIGPVPNAMNLSHNSAPQRALQRFAQKEVSRDDVVVHATASQGDQGWSVSAELWPLSRTTCRD